MVEHFDQIGCDLDLDKFLKQAEMFSEPSLEDPLEHCFAQFEFDLDLNMSHEHAEALLDSVTENNKVEEEEEKNEVPRNHIGKRKRALKLLQHQLLFPKYKESKREVCWGYVMSILRTSR